MTSTNDLITRARALLAAATPGVVQPEDVSAWYSAQDTLHAAAPALLAALCDEVERLEHEQSTREMEVEAMLRSHEDEASDLRARAECEAVRAATLAAVCEQATARWSRAIPRIRAWVTSRRSTDAYHDQWLARLWEALTEAGVPAVAPNGRRSAVQAVQELAAQRDAARTEAQALGARGTR